MTFTLKMEQNQLELLNILINQEIQNSEQDIKNYKSMMPTFASLMDLKIKDLKEIRGKLSVALALSNPVYK
jgi:hypothetical protein